MHFGQYWTGESLEDQTIEVFCDQGMGDTINLLRYLYELKRRWNCRIVLNCYAFHEELKRFMACVPCVDQFEQLHVPCHYFTNIMSIPAILAGIKLDVYYPAHFRLIMRHDIPEQPRLGPFPKIFNDPGFKVGLAWQTNPENELSAMKSVPVTSICQLESGKQALYQLTPITEHYNFVCQPRLGDLYDTACLIESMDCVVSVDTCVLHLAGAMRKNTYALLSFTPDPRWETDGVTPWYPSVKLLKQPENLDWSVPINKVREALAVIS
jgi:hypothetical protein